MIKSFKEYFILCLGQILFCPSSKELCSGRCRRHKFLFQNGGRLKFGAANKPLRGQKFDLYEGGTKTAAFISGPKILKKSNIVSKEYVHLQLYSN